MSKSNASSKSKRSAANKDGVLPESSAADGTAKIVPNAIPG